MKKEKDIKAVFARRDIFRGKRLVFYRAENSIKRDEGTELIHRFCIMVSKKCGKAVKRNRIKRVIREILRNNRDRIKTGYDYIVRVEPAAITGHDIKQDLFIDDFKSYFRWN